MPGADCFGEIRAGMSSVPPRASGAGRSRQALIWSALVAALLIGFAVDGSVMAAVQPLHHSGFAELLSSTIRWLGNGRVQVPLLICLAALGAGLSRPLLRAAGWGVLAFAISGAAANIIKVIVHRPRPWVTAASPDSWWGYARMSEFQSFPSGDASTTFAIATLFAVLYPRLRAPLVGVAIIVAVARVLVGSHHPSDIAAGAMLGVGVGQLVGGLAARREAGPAGSSGTAGDGRVLRALPFAALMVGAAVAYTAGLGAVSFLGRDEALYAEAAREMLATGDWVTPRVNGVPFFEKPPLYYWMAAPLYQVFGVTPLAARLPAALMALATIAATALLAGRVWGRRAGLLAGAALATCLQLAIIGRMGVMDVPLTCLITLALIIYGCWRRDGRWSAALAFGALVGLAVLLKGLAGGLAPAIALVHLVVYRTTPRRISLLSVLAALGIFAAVIAPWFLAMGARHGEGYASILFLREHFTRVVEPMQGHSGPPIYYLALIALSFFPWVIFVPAAALAREHRADEAEAFWWSLALVWIAVVLVPFSFISTKLPGYVTPLFPAMALLVGAELDRRLDRPGRAPWIAGIAGAALLGLLVSVLPLAGAVLGERLGVAAESRRLVLPAALWVAGYGVIALGAARALSNGPRAGIGALIGGQAIALCAVLAGFLPVLAPYLAGAPALLAEVARRELPGRRVLLYDTRPEAAAFALGRSVPVFSADERRDLLRALERGPAAVIAPLSAGELRSELPVRRAWREGDRVLLDVPAPPTQQAATDHTR